MYKTLTVIAAGLTSLSMAAQADTIKQIWNQEISEENPGQVIAADKCLQDESSAFGCWNEGDEDTPDNVSPAGSPPNGEGEVN